MISRCPVQTQQFYDGQMQLSEKDFLCKMFYLLHPMLIHLSLVEGAIVAWIFDEDGSSG